MQACEAVAELVEAVIGCKFEETQHGHDEAVRARIMQVLVACLVGGAGTWLPDEVVWEVLQTCLANLDQMVRAYYFVYYDKVLIVFWGRWLTLFTAPQLRDICIFHLCGILAGLE